MRFSSWGVLIATVIGLFPFIPWFGLLSGGTTVKYFLFIALVDVLILGAAYLASSGRSWRLSFKQPLLLAAILVVTTQLLTAATGTFFMHSFWSDSARTTGIFLFMHVLFFACAAGAFLRADDWRLVARALSVSAGIMAVVTLIGLEGFGYTGNLLWFNLGTRDPFFGNETSLGMYLVLAAVFSAIEFIRTKNLRWRWVLGLSIAATALSPVLFHTSILLGRVDLAGVLSHPQSILGLTRASSAIFMAFLVFLAGWWGIHKVPHTALRKGLKVALVVGAIGACVLGSVLLVTPGSPVQNALVTERVTAQRFIVWEGAEAAIAERPWLGWGPENYDRAFEAHFDPRLYEQKDRVEGWFDKAHNVVLDTLASTGVVGLVAFLCLLAAYVFTLYRARKRNALTETECMLWLALPVIHLTQLQTAFDVLPTYVLLAVAGAYVFSLEGAEVKPYTPRRFARRIAAGVLAVAAVMSIGVTFFNELPRQAALVGSLSESDEQRRSDLIEYSLSRVSDFEGLHRTANLFAGSVFDALNESSDQKEMLVYARKYIDQYIAAYERYLLVQPEHYRARMNYAYLLLLQQQWGGENRTDEALHVIKDSYALSPHNPTTYILNIMAAAYAGDFPAAHSALESLRTLAPDIQFTKDGEAWLSKQEQLFPLHSFLIISNI